MNSPKLFCISQDNAIDESQKHRYKSDDIEYRPDMYDATHLIKLKCDNGNFMQLSCFWCGYFERLHKGKIVIDITDTEINF